MKTMGNIDYEQISYDQINGVRPILINLIHTRLHWHSELEIIFVCQGSIALNIRGSQYQLRQGDIGVINSEEIHAVNSNTDERTNSVFLLQINSRFLREFHLDFETLRYKPVLPKSDATRELRRILLLVIDELQNKNTAYMMAIHGYCGYIIALLTRHFVQHENQGADANQYAGNEINIKRIKQIFDYIHRHYQENPSLKDIASVIFVSPYYLSHFFTAAVGMTYSQYLNTIKIDMVQQDLITTTDSITDIMLRHGFTNTKTFNRVFKNTAGCTPRTYRKNTRIQNTPEPLMPLMGEKNDPAFADPPLNTKMGSYVNFHSRVDIPRELYREYIGETAEQSEAPLFREIYPNMKGPVKTLDRYYKKMISTARAGDLLRASIREQLKIVQKDIGFEYIHFHGIFNDEMGILPPGGG
jgi:xylan 1,4-beta-xylosidase